MDGRYRRVVDLVELTGLFQTRRGGLSLDDIADRFDVSRRTAERMLGALRDRFPELDFELREGRKYWRLPAPGPAGAIRLPDELTTLTRRVEELEAEADVGGKTAALAEVFERCEVGVFILDSHFRVVWVNRALESFFGISRHALIGRDKSELIRSRIRDLFAEPDRFQQRVLATYADNTYVENFECQVKRGPGHEERWLEHRSQPIDAGPWRGGRIEHYVDISAAHGDRIAANEVLADSIQAPLDELIEAARAALAGSAEDATRTLEEVAQLAENIDKVLGSQHQN